MKTIFLGVAAVLALCACGATSAQTKKTGSPDLPPLFRAIDANDAAGLKAALDGGGDVHAVFEGETLLCFALKDGKTADIAKQIIRRPGIDVNRRGVYTDRMGTTWERTPLILAALQGNAEIVGLLLDKGAYLDARDSVDGAPQGQGDTALMCAAMKNRLDAARALLSRPVKPDLRLRNKDSKTALWFAADNDNLAMVRLLSDNGAVAVAAGGGAGSVLATTIVHKTSAVFDFLVGRGADINLAGSGGITPLIEAVAVGNKDRKAALKFLERFIALGPRLDHVSEDESALHVAVRTGFTDAVKLLLDKGARIDIASRATGGTPLHSAVLVKNVEMARYLVKRGANLESRAAGGSTPLSTAVSLYDMAMVRTLVESGAVIDSRNPVNPLMTPLIVAAASVNPLDHAATVAIIKYLLDKKAGIDFAAANGRTALMATVVQQDQDRALEKAKLLVGRGAKTDLANNSGETALMLAAGAGNDGIVRFLVDKGADLRRKNVAGETVTSYAQRSGKKALVDYLRTKGAALDAGTGWTGTVVEALVGTWQGSQDGLAQAVFKLVLKRDGMFDFESRYSAEVLRQFPAGVNPVIAAQKGRYTVDKDTLVLSISGAAPLARKWKLENGVLILDGTTRMKKTY